MRCDIIMPVWNELEATRGCVESLQKNTGYPYRLIIVDNGSDRDTAVYLAGLKARADINARIIRNEDNLGFARAVNQGIAESDAKYICIMNNDTIAAAGWLEEMVRVMEKHPEFGILNPSSNTSGQKEAQATPGEIQELYRARGFCMLIKRDVIDRVGTLDESYGRGYFEETDYSYRAQGAGIRIARAKASYVYHEGCVSFKKLSDAEDLFKRNEKIFQEKWGRPLKVGYLLERIDSKNRINDIATSVARSGHQISIFLKRGLEWPVNIDHFDIRRSNVSPVFFGLFSTMKILKRNRKKKLDIILTDNAYLGNFLKKTGVAQDSDIIICPDKEVLIKLLKQKARGAINGG